MSQSKTILVTGASRGIGLLAAKLLAENGHYVYASMRDKDGRNKSIAQELQGWADETGLLLEPLELDVTKDTSVSEAIDKIEEHRPLDVLVNNAGVMPTGLTEAFHLDDVQKYFDVNVYGIMRACRAALPYMRARKKGLIVSVSSAAGRLAIPNFGIYCATKWAMEAYCESLSYELEEFGIESILVEPSGHGTDLVKTAPAPTDGYCIEGYGNLAGGRDRMLGMFQDMFDQGDITTDAGNVASCILKLVEQTAPRSIRTQIGHDMGVRAINEATTPIQAELIKALKPVYSGSVEKA